MNAQQLREIYPHARSRADLFAPLIDATMIEFLIDTPARQAAFIAQIGHESGQLRYTEEIASGAAYEGRGDLGNTQPGDGKRFKGRGLIQVTGRSNYRACGVALGVDLISDPTQLTVPDLAARSAGWFWRTINGNRYADEVLFAGLTKRINGGYNGIDDRIQLWLAARRVLNVG